MSGNDHIPKRDDRDEIKLKLEECRAIIYDQNKDGHEYFPRDNNKTSTYSRDIVKSVAYKIYTAIIKNERVTVNLTNYHCGSILNLFQTQTPPKGACYTLDVRDKNEEAIKEDIKSNIIAPIKYNIKDKTKDMHFSERKNLGATFDTNQPEEIKQKLTDFVDKVFEIKKKNLTQEKKDAEEQERQNKIKERQKKINLKVDEINTNLTETCQLKVADSVDTPTLTAYKKVVTTNIPDNKIEYRKGIYEEAITNEEFTGNVINKSSDEIEAEAQQIACIEAKNTKFNVNQHSKPFHNIIKNRMDKDGNLLGTGLFNNLNDNYRSNKGSYEKITGIIGTNYDYAFMQPPPPPPRPPPSIANGNLQINTNDNDGETTSGQDSPSGVNEPFLEEKDELDEKKLEADYKQKHNWKVEYINKTENFISRDIPYYTDEETGEKTLPGEAEPTWYNPWIKKKVFDGRNKKFDIYVWMLPGTDKQTLRPDTTKKPNKHNYSKPTFKNPWFKIGDKQFENYLTNEIVNELPPSDEWKEYMIYNEAPYFKSFWKKGDKISKSNPEKNQRPKKGGKNMHNKTKRKNKNKTKRKIHKLKRNITKLKDKRNMKKSKSMRTRR